MAVLRVYAENIHTNWKGSLGKRQTLTLHHCVSIFKPPWPLPLFFIYSQLQLLNACSSYPQSVLYNNFHAINGSLLQIGQGKQFSLSVQESDKAGKASQQMKLWTERKGCRNTGAWKKGSGLSLGVFPISHSTCMNSLFLQHLVMRNEEIIWLPLWRSSCQENPHPTREIPANMIKMCILSVQ